ncbi:MAG: protein translocase subunit SecF [Deltaproteobacteria bacterium CG_4_8_14_3_um_filter_43_13]|nr:MAG: protein-export membrane protein SecF [Deltaproteobacteria bacterium CG2_30_43_15]PIU84886.1 MAG: protein translocase subunit SecF [Deltaproteobacteria bacterium CG06_land_8_20_14_3_00_44_19]PIX23500.1 MAG: protein translocase subunit SecF [Deltaproteobacteria bacterium CG_4_8_14_3_um_filter_43_13]PIZ20010.1 MAG: protein translocase subunit SecF [Deltaproteobacteria bacterium CG_4_10_14_0_8_um_filter_43_12]
MISIVKPEINIDFLGRRWIAFMLSSILILASILSIVLKGGLNFGIDFAGGALVQVRFTNETTPGEIRKVLNEIGLRDSIIQQYSEKGGNEYIIRFKNTSSKNEGLSDRVQETFQKRYGQNGFEIRRVEVVGPQVEKELRYKALMALIYGMIGILVYIGFRFEFRFALGGVLALVHDVTVTIGAFSITDREFTLPVLAAVLTIVGFSINDTIVIYDRIRENRRKMAGKKLELIMNSSINETLSRTILTSGTVLFVVIALFILGGSVIHDFAFALIVGVIAGTYSTVFVASPIVLLWEKFFPGKKGKRR